ncbi:hypothetical protein HFO60_04520 [Rhizobium leguminosarum]|uniref:hypothetical protein n=1 Tax=Rhizobium leguminosarum TaxID=384 RepID=UPI001C953B98|nr:hypothetical protein [Rhizobium leguminosarum]MBY5539315.1 hypothetical protein [Rhizobium leguminosarum]
MATQATDHGKQEHTIGFAVRLTQDDLDPVTRAWRFPALQLPGASLQEVYADGERIDPEKYRIVGSQLRWVPSDKLPEKLTALVSVDSESRDEIFQSRDEAKKNEDWWKKFATIVPIITAFIAAAVSLYVANTSKAASVTSPSTQTLTMRIAPVDFDKRMPSPKISVNGQEIATPYTASLKADTLALVDLSDNVGLMDALRSRDQRSREFLAKVVDTLASVDDPLTKASSTIINSCPGGSSGQTPANGSVTIGLINKARTATTQLKAEADFLTREQTPR